MVGSVFVAWCGLACNAPPAPYVSTEAHDHADPALQERKPGQPSAAALHGAGLVRLDEHAHVCMLSNRYLGDRPHVPVEVDGKTYYGCCPSCASRLAAHPEAREAHDAWTGRPLDKASAIMARDGQNRVLYFENQASFAQYAAQP